MLAETKLIIRHFPDRKKPCICLEQGNQSIIIATIRNSECEDFLRRYLGGTCLFGEMEELFTEEKNDE